MTAATGAGLSQRYRPRFQPWTIAIAAILLLGAWLRFAYMDWGAGHPDEPITVRVVEQIERSGRLDTNHAIADLPPMFRYDDYNFSSYLLASWVLDVTLKPIVKPLLAAPRRDGYTVTLLFHRYCSAGLGVILCWLTYLLARRYVPRPFAAFACLLAAVFPQLVQDSHYARPEMFVAVLFVGALLLFDSDWRHESLWVYLAACFLTGNLVACKSSMILLAAVALAPWRPRRLLPAGAAMLLGFAVGAPYALAHPAAWWHGVQILREQYGVAFGPYSTFPLTDSFGTIHRYYAQTSGWGLALLCGFGVVALASGRHWRGLVLLPAPVAAYYVFFGMQLSFFERNLTHVVPLYAILAAIGVAALFALAPQGNWRTVAAACVMLGAVSMPLGWSHMFVTKVLNPAAPQYQSQYEPKLLAAYPDLEFVREEMFYSREINNIRRNWLANPTGFLLCIWDFGDEVSRFNAHVAEGLFDMRRLADLPTPLDGLPGSTRFAHTQSLHYFLVPPDLLHTRSARKVALSEWTIQGGWQPSGGFSKDPPKDASIEYTLGSWNGSDANTGEIRSPELHLCPGSVLATYIMPGPDPTGVVAGVDLNLDGTIDERMPPAAPGAWTRWVYQAEHDSRVRFIARDDGTKFGQWLAIAQPVVYSASPCP